MRSRSSSLVTRLVLAVGWICFLFTGNATHAGKGDDALDEARKALMAWDMPGAQRAIAQLQLEAPDDPATLFVTGHLHLMQGRYAEAVDMLEKTQRIQAEHSVSHYLNIARNTLEETQDYLEHRTADGNFIIRYPSGVEAVLLPYAEHTLSAAWSALTKLFDYVPPEPVRVEIYPRADVLGAVSSLTVSEIRTSGTIALCKYNRLMIVSPRDLVYGYTWTDTLAHEFIHLLITQKSRNKVPIWLHEGLAKYYESAWRPDRKPRLERPSEDLLARALESNGLISFEEMSPSMAKLPSQEATATAFAEVFTVIKYLVSRRGPMVAAELVELMGTGKTDREAVAEVSGLTWKRFTPAWKNYLKQLSLRKLEHVFDHKLLFKGHSSETEELQALQGEKARRFTWLGDQLRMKDRWKAAVKEYEKAVTFVGRKTPIIQSKLGYALLKLGRVDDAIAQLKQPLAVYPNYVLLRLYMGEALLSKGAYEDALNHLNAAVELNPFDPDLHHHLALTYEKLGRDDLASRERRLHQLIQH